jgi:hypothetical protein
VAASTVAARADGPPPEGPRTDEGSFADAPVLDALPVDVAGVAGADAVPSEDSPRGHATAEDAVVVDAPTAERPTEGTA